MINAPSLPAYSAICPTHGIDAAMVMPRCDAATMQWRLDEVTTQIALGAHGVILLDQADWHTTDMLGLPASIAPVSLPPRSSELNLIENIWQYMRKN